jgi:tetratricopeptide (TPR) repeat protein
MNRASPPLRIELLAPWLLPRVALFAVAAVVGAAGLASPAAPGALARADAALARGDVAGALSAYEAVATWHPFESTRAEAALRAAAVEQVERDDPAAARHRLHAFLADDPSNPWAAEAWARLGDLSAATQPNTAANAYEHAYDADPRAPGAADRLAAAADAWRAAGQRAAAFRAWDRLVAASPDHRAAAWLNEAAWLLADGDAERALTLYEKSAGIAADAPSRQAARLGEAACHERLGEADEALGALDEADLPEAVAQPRAASLRARATGHLSTLGDPRR